MSDTEIEQSSTQFLQSLSESKYNEFVDPEVPEYKWLGDPEGPDRLAMFTKPIRPGADMLVSYDVTTVAGVKGFLIRAVEKGSDDDEWYLRIGGEKESFVPGDFVLVVATNISGRAGRSGTGGFSFKRALMGAGGLAAVLSIGNRLIKNRIPPGSHVNLKGLDPKAVALYNYLAAYLEQQGIEGPWVTSAVRSVPSQARVMSRNWKDIEAQGGDGREYLRKLYNKKGNKAKAAHFDRFVDVLTTNPSGPMSSQAQAQTTQIVKDMKSDGVFPSSHKVGRALDLRSHGKYGEGTRDALETAIGELGRWHKIDGIGHARWIYEARPHPHFHVVVK